MELREFVSQETRSVYDNAFHIALRELPWGDWFLAEKSPFDCRERYLSTIVAWIASSHLSKITGLEAFAVRDLVNGTTQSFDDAYFRHASRRLRFFRGEYAYHRRVFPNHLFLEDAPLDAGDFVIISAPFCSTGDLHPQFYALLDEAEHLGVPVIVDCAYFGTSHGFQINVNHPAIESVSFSLTKSLGLGHIRSGIRFSNLRGASPISQQNQYNHTVLAAARVGIYMMEKFSPDFIPLKYRKAQESACRDLGIHPTPCMHIALGDNSWNAFQVDDIYFRIGIRELVKARLQGRV